MAECNGCGACCDPFQMVFSPADIVTFAYHIDPDELAFYRQHLTPIRRADGRRMVPWNSGWSEVVVQGKAMLMAAHYYKCDRYDTETRRCTDYENRPVVCREYPWYGEPPDPLKSLPPTCSYREEIGLPVEPFDVPVPDPTTRAKRGC
jgi:Fe-S-cluster containining protein